MSIKGLNQQIKRCKKCRLYKNANAVVGEGPVRAKVMLIGQNPGEEENKSGRPFVGRSGKFLNKILEKNKINRKELFITNVVKHKTPKNRAPKTDEAKICSSYLLEEIKIIKPKVIVLMGSIAKKYTPRKKGIKYIETYHPAIAMRFSERRKVFEKDFKGLQRVMKGFS
jgi:DNA polymerase